MAGRGRSKAEPYATGLIVALLFAPLALSAQAGGVYTPQPPVQRAAPAPLYRPEDLGSIEGQVINSLTGAPVNKVFVMLSHVDGRGGSSATSDPSGRFGFRNVAPGSYRIVFSRPGFQGASNLDAFPVIALDRGQKRTDVVLRVTPLGAIAGRVVDEDGDPVTSAQVQALRFYYVQGRKQLAPTGSATTNDLGEYRVFNILPGRYLVSASYSRVGRIVVRSEGGPGGAMMFSADPGGDEDYATTFYPGTIDATAAAVIEVAPAGQVQSINFRLSKTRTVKLSGRVAGPSLGQRAAIILTLARRNSFGTGSTNRTTSTDFQGNFEISNVLPGSYVLTARVSQAGNLSYSARQFLEVGPSNVEGVSFTIPPPAEVRGRIRVEDQNAPPARNLRVSWRDVEGASGQAGSARVNDDGTFTLENVSLDRYYLELTGLPNGYYIKSIRAGAAEALTAGLDLSGGAVGPIEIVLSPRAGQITGVAQNQNKPAAGATVALIPQEKERRARDSFYRTATTDEAGRFTLRNIIPGDYKLFAWEQMEESGAYMDPDFVAPVEDKGQAVTIREGDKPDVQLAVITK